MIATLARIGLLHVALASGARAADIVTIGAIYPLGQAGDAKAAIKTAVDIVNTPHAGLEKLPLGAGQGLPKLGGTRLAVDYADDLGNPSVAEAQALRLISRDHVAALIGAGRAAETLAATALAERHGVPFLVPDDMAPAITARGFSSVFRTTPLRSDIARSYAQFLGAQKQAGTKIDTVALVFDDSARGRSLADPLRDGLKAAGFATVDIDYPLDATDLSASMTQLRDTHPDAAIVRGGTADAILLIKTLKNLGYTPPILIGDGAGFADPGFVASVGNLAQGIIGRSVWTPDKPDSPPAIVDQLYQARSGHDPDDRSARTMQGFFVLADAIDRAGSTDRAAILAALRQTDLLPDRLIVGYDGVKFDQTGQNTLGSTYLTQLQGKQYVAVWPAERVEGKLQRP